MMASPRWLVACAAIALLACVEPVDDPDDGDDGDPTYRFSPDECTAPNPGPGGIDDGMVGVCHAADSGYTYVRVSPEACRQGHADHALDFRSDDPLCRLLPGPGRSHEPVVDTVH